LDTGVDPEQLESRSFIVKFWLEETVQESGRAVWRGHVTHVPSGERRYIREPSEIPAFISPYLASPVRKRRRVPPRDVP
jgi:hypothetical protein